MESLKHLPIEDRIGISTHFLPSTHGEDIFEAIRAVSEAGFAGFELVPSLDQAQLGYPENHANVGFDLIDSTKDERKRLKEALKVFKWVTIHGPNHDWNLARANRHFRRLTADYFDRSIEFAGEIDAVAATFHAGRATDGFIRDKKRIWEINLEYAKHAAPMAKKLGVPVGYEAGVIEHHKHYCDHIPNWGINLDIGHAYMSVFSDENFFKFFDAFKGRIWEIHQNGVNQFWDNNMMMEHQPVHLNNTIDYQGCYERLKKDDYVGPIVCELQGQEISQAIRHCLEAKEMIVGIWNGTRRLKYRWNVPE